MASIIKVDDVQDAAGNNIINEAGDVITIGASGDTITIPSGATITNSGTATGFGGITVGDQWRLTTTFSGDADPIASNWEQIDVAARLQGTLGSAMTESSGVFTFPSTGIYLVIIHCNYAINGDDRSVTVNINATNDDTAYAVTAQQTAFIQQTSSNWTGSSAAAQTLVDVQDTANDKVSFSIDGQNGSTEVQGSTNESLTSVTFTRLGDT